MKTEEAINILSERYGSALFSERTALETLIPELRENEDERMMGVIRLALTDVPEERFTTEGTSLSEVLAWMEKQKEQKPSINIDQLKSLMLQYLQEAANEKEDSDIEADTDKWARKILEYDFKRNPAEGIKGNLEEIPSNVDLEKELQAFLCNYDYEFDDDPVPFDIATHFYELGFNARKEK